ncbi:MAG: hypothetical protein LBU32_25750 [Clostridiales bacterium]|nr:hypothetical protein [Clostridiales bacterium]
MEGAGAYWRPACGVLEGAFGGDIGVIAANARDMRNARGKKKRRGGCPADIAAAARRDS